MRLGHLRGVQILLPVLLAAVVVTAQMQFAEDASATSSSEPSLQDYLDFGK